MEAHEEEDLLASIRRFIGKDDPEEPERKLSLVERSQGSVVLLRTLPTVRSAVLEQIGNIFEELAHSYIIEAERHLLAGQHFVTDVKDPALDELVSSVQETLNEFVDCNTMAWAPQIVKWSVTVLGKICGQYGIFREFSKLNIDGRLQLWMNCSATRLLLEISVGCFAQVIKDNPDAAVEDLIRVACEHNPYFDWVLVQYCCSFPDVLPGRLLSHALQEFSMQARDAEVVINMSMRIFNKLVKQHQTTLEDAVVKLFKESVAVWDRNKEQTHIADCTIPFLLHVGKLCSTLADRAVGRFLSMMDPETLAVLRMQSERRDKVLQKGMSLRVLEMISKLGKGSYKVIQFLINFACGSDVAATLDHDLQMEVRRVCRDLLENLSVKLHNHTHQRFVRNQRTEALGPQQHEEFVPENPFLKDLQQYSKQLCSQYFNSSGMRQKILAQFLVLTGILGGKESMTDILSHSLTITPPSSNSACVTGLQVEFEIYHEGVMQESVRKVVAMISSDGKHFGVSQICKILTGFNLMIEDELSSTVSGRARVVDCLQLEWKRLLQLLNLDELELSDAVLSTLELLKIPGAETQVSEIFLMTNMILAFYFDCVKRILSGHEENRVISMLERSEDILFQIIKENMILQQSMIRTFVENIFLIEEINNTDEDSKVPANRDGSKDCLKSTHTHLLKENSSPDVVSRLPTNTVSVMYAGSLNKNRKRKNDDSLEATIEPTKQHVRQLLYNFLVGLLSPDNRTVEDVSGRNKSFADVWLERKVGPRFPSSHAFLASLLAEVVCPDVHPMLPWPDEEFLKYTIERNLRIKRRFDNNVLLWQCIDLISVARPALCHCSTIIQSLYAYCLMYWQVERTQSPKQSPRQLKLTQRIFGIMDNAGWLPYPISTVGDIFEFVKPKEIYQIMSYVWKFCTENAFAVERFTSRDRFGQPCIPFQQDAINQLREMLKQIFYNNIETLGVFYSRFITADLAS